jgi:hypothetical protein
VRALLLAVALAAATSVQAADPKATQEPAARSVWELDAFVGYGQIAFPFPDTASDLWWNGGPALALSVAYRGPHFTHPFVDISWVPVLSSGRNTYIPGSNTGTVSSSSSSAIGLAIGPGWDIDWFRVRVGVGLYDVFVSSTVNGVTNSTSAASIGFMAALAAQVWRPDPFALGLEARVVGLQSPMNGFYEALWQVGITGRWDFSRK